MIWRRARFTEADDEEAVTSSSFRTNRHTNTCQKTKTIIYNSRWHHACRFIRMSQNDDAGESARSWCTVRSAYAKTLNRPSITVCNCGLNLLSIRTWREMWAWTFNTWRRSRNHVLIYPPTHTFSMPPTSTSYIGHSSVISPALILLLLYVAINVAVTKHATSRQVI